MMGVISAWPDVVALNDSLEESYRTLALYPSQTSVVTVGLDRLNDKDNHLIATHLCSKVLRPKLKIADALTFLSLP